MVRGEECAFLYNFVLSRGHVVIVDGVECVTLAHGIQDEVVAHESVAVAVAETWVAKRGNKTRSSFFVESFKMHCVP